MNEFKFKLFLIVFCLISYASATKILAYEEYSLPEADFVESMVFVDSNGNVIKTIDVSCDYIYPPCLSVNEGILGIGLYEDGRCFLFNLNDKQIRNVIDWLENRVSLDQLRCFLSLENEEGKNVCQALTIKHSVYGIYWMKIFTDLFNRWSEKE